MVNFEVSATDLVDSDPIVECDASPGDTFDFGQTTVTCTATDDSDNQATDSFTVTVEDTQTPNPPVISFPVDNGKYNTVQIAVTGTAEPFSTITVYQGALALATNEG